MLMAPANQTFAELLSNGVKYKVPRFQRDYSWEQAHLEDLWNDILSLKEEGSHYMGYIVLQQQGSHEYDVIDGQQRMVTLSLWVLAAMSKVKALIDLGEDASNNQIRYDELARLIGSKDIVTLRASNKLILNRNNNTYYKDISSNLRITQQRVTTTNKLLQKTFEFFRNKNFGSTGEQIASFVLESASHLLFTKIVVQDNFNAYKVFETLNARGVQLSTPDLLKNYIFSVVTQDDNVPDETLDDLDEQWANILLQLGETNFTDLVRYQYNATHSHVTKRDLFKAIRSTYQTPQEASTYLRDLSEAAPIFSALSNPHDEWWQNNNGLYGEAVHYLDGLDLFGIKQPWVVLLVAYQKFTAEEFVKVLHYIYILSVRYNVIGYRSPNEQENAYSKIAQKISRDEFQRASHVKNSEEFRNLYPQDIEFQSSFAFQKMPSRRSSKKIRFLLAEIEKNLGRNTNYLTSKLEHICPYELNQAWSASFGDGVNDVADRLGNLVLLDRDDLRRVEFNVKKESYKTSGFKLAEKVAQSESWNLRELNNYQAWLAEQAVKTWRIDYS